jgi:Glycosyltransferase family 87
MAGVLIGLLTVKPQLGILFPVALIVSKRWEVLFVAAATALALLAASVAIGGIAGWQDYVTKALPLQREVLQDAAGTAMPFQPSIFMNIRGVIGNHAGEIIQFAFRCSLPARFRPRPIWEPMICCR